MKRSPIAEASLFSGHGWLKAGGAKIRAVILLLTFVLALLATLPVSAEEVAYEPSLQGIQDPSLEAVLRQVADTFSLRDRPPATAGLLRRRAQGDISRMLKALQSEGYYGADVALDMDEKARPVTLRFRIDKGPLYAVEAVDLEIESGATPFGVEGLPDLTEPLLKIGAPARADDILKAKTRLIETLKDRGHPFAEVRSLKVYVDHEPCTVRVAISLAPGPSARFGETGIAGLTTVEEPYVREKLDWRTGERYNASLLNRARSRLLETGLFAVIEPQPGKTLDSMGRIPIHVTLKERKHRTVGVGGRYRTDEGPGVQGSWKHRNLFGMGERLALDATVSPDLLGLKSMFRKPEFYRPDQSLLLEADAVLETPGAFSSRRLYLAGGLERKVSDRLTLGGGMGLTTSQVDQLGEEEGYALLSLPLRLDWDGSDDLLNPTVGTRAALRLTPFTEILDEDMQFIKAYGSLSLYLPLARDPSLVLATRCALGSMIGASRDRIPADERFYAGGGGSVRGLPYQTAGPLQGDHPLGGRSLVEVSAELRWRLNRSFGLVGFVDGGRAFEETFPESLGDLHWGAGAGVRYYTFLGPLRLDVGVPLDRREGVDDAYQVYVSLGQAF